MAMQYVRSGLAGLGMVFGAMAAEPVQASQPEFDSAVANILRDECKFNAGEYRQMASDLNDIRQMSGALEQGDGGAMEIGMNMNDAEAMDDMGELSADLMDALAIKADMNARLAATLTKNGYNARACMGLKPPGL